MNERRLHHFLPKWAIAALNVSLADKEKLFRDPSLSVLPIASSSINLEFWLLGKVSAWWSDTSLSVFQNFKTSLPRLTPETIQFTQYFAARSVNLFPSTFWTSTSPSACSESGRSLLSNAVSYCDHKPTLAIYSSKEMLTVTEWSHFTFGKGGKRIWATKLKKI